MTFLLPKYYIFSSNFQRKIRSVLIFHSDVSCVLFEIVLVIHINKENRLGGKCEKLNSSYDSLTKIEFCFCPILLILTLKQLYPRTEYMNCLHINLTIMQRQKV